MEVYAPQYYVNFRCLAGDCPHTCCAGWEVPIDPDTAALYRSLPGSLGEELRALLTAGQDGEASFPLRGNYCPFLDSDRLCRIHKQLGQEATGVICRTHPRFSYDYGSLREEGLCASCCEAARMILEEDPVLTLRQDDVPAQEAPPLLSPLLLARKTAFALLATQEASLSQRLQALLLFANEVQVLLDEEQLEALPQLCRIYEENFPLLSVEALPSPSRIMEGCLTLLAGLEILHPQWRELLTAGLKHLAAGAPASPPPSGQGKRAATYFLYRHWLRGVWDGDVLSWAQFAVLGVVVSALLAPFQEEGFPGVLRLFCEELEHNEANLSALQDAFWDQFSLAEFLSIAGS